MNYHSLFAWLSRQATNIETGTYSTYFTINNRIVRYSDHFSANKCDICIVKTESFYIITFHTYQSPKLIAKVADVKTFLSVIFDVWKMTTPSLTYHVPEIKEYNVKCNTVESIPEKNDFIPLIQPKKEIVATTVVNPYKQFIKDKYDAQIPLSLKQRIENYVLKYPQYTGQVIDFLKAYGNKKNQREQIWNNFIKTHK